jgi:CBS domain-containing protein
VTDAARQARRTPVRACMDLLPIDPLLVDQDADPLSLVREAAARPETRTIGVVDRDGVLVGIVPTLRLAETVVARVSPETLLAGAADMREAARFGAEVAARRMADVMLPVASVGPDATVDEAFRVMHQRRLSGLYVTDPAGRPIGYLDLLEVTIRYLDALEASPTQTD